jgi:epoxyqueuosine reductase
MARSFTSQLRLTDRVREFALDNGAHLVGVAPVERFEGAPRGHHPRDFMPDCRSVVVIASRILDRGTDHPHMMPHGSEFIPDEGLRELLQDYLWEIECYGPTSDLLSMLGLRAAMILQDAGYGSLCFRSSDSDFYGEHGLKGRIKPYHSLFSHRHAAVRAGLGEFGLDNVVVTPEYGQRVRLVSVLTAAELEPSPLLKEKVCLGTGCGLCLFNCEEYGVLRLLPEAETDEVWLNPVGVTDKELCVKTRKRIYCRGQCIGNCPVGVRALRA